MSMHTLAARVAALEARIADLEGGYGETLYQLRRSTVRTELAVTRLLTHAGFQVPTDEEVDAIIDES